VKNIVYLLIFSALLWSKEETVRIRVEGMTCPLCTMTIKKNLKKQPGVSKAKVRLNTKMATVVYDDNKTDIQQLLRAISEVGYKGYIDENNTNNKEQK